MLHRGRSVALHVALTDAGGGAGAWSVSVRQVSKAAGVALRVAAVTVPGSLTLRAIVSQRAPVGDSSGFVVLSRGGQSRRIPYWLRVTAPKLGLEPHQVLRHPGIYRGDTRRGRALVTSYRYPAAPCPSGCSPGWRGPEQVFRFVIRRRVANAGAVILSQGPGVHIAPRLVRAGSEDRLAGFAALPLRINPYEPGYYGIEPVVGVFRPTPGTYDLVFDTPNRRRAGSFTFRFWVDDTTPPFARLLTPGSRQVRGSGCSWATAAPASTRARSWPRSTAASAGSSTGPRMAWYRWRFLACGPGGTVLFSVSDNQETKNTENEHLTLPNTRRLVTTFVVR